MAKDLTYFKFIVSEWNDGDVTLCSLAAQGLFVNLCSLYWSREGNLPLKFAQKKLERASKKVWTELISEQILTIVDQKVVISFLDEQLKNVEFTSVQNSENAKKRWKPTKQDAPALPAQCDPSESAKHLDKIREDKIREDKNIGIKPFDSSEYYPSGKDAFEDIQKDEVFVERLLFSVHQAGFRSCTAITLIKSIRFFLGMESAKDDVATRPKKEVRRHLVNWINKNASKLDDYAK